MPQTHKAKNYTVILVLLLTLNGCTSLKPGLTAHFNHYNDNDMKTYTKVNIWFGPYWMGSNGASKQFKSKSTRIHNGELKGKELVAWWKILPSSTQQTSATNNEDRVKTKYYYARTKPGEGINLETKSIFNNTNYHAYISFGKIYLPQQGFSSNQLSKTNLVRTSPSGINYHSFGSDSKIYYKVFADKVDVTSTPTLWDAVEAIEISEKQFNQLNQRCQSKTYEVTCFIDPSFTDLTATQLSYVNERTHQNDQARLNGEIKTKVKPTPNPWK